MMHNKFLAALVSMVFAGEPAWTCGVDTDCFVGDRTYRVFVPEGAGDAAIEFFHGVGGRAEQQVRNDGLRGIAHELGAILVAAQSAEREWNVPGAPADYAANAVAELEYFDSLQTDLAARFGTDSGATIVAGFSSGSMVVWNLACFRGKSAAGFVAVSGTLWKPFPETCPTLPQRLIHYHGRSDTVVPLVGRAVKNSRQGDVRTALRLISGSEVDLDRVDRGSSNLACSTVMNDDRSLIEVCQFDGGHTFRTEFVRDAVERFDD